MPPPPLTFPVLLSVCTHPYLSVATLLHDSPIHNLTLNRVISISTATVLFAETSDHVSLLLCVNLSLHLTLLAELKVNWETRTVVIPKTIYVQQVVYETKMVPIQVGVKTENLPKQNCMEFEVQMAHAQLRAP